MAASWTRGLIAELRHFGECRNTLEQLEDAAPSLYLCRLISVSMQRKQAAPVGKRFCISAT